VGAGGVGVDLGVVFGTGWWGGLWFGEK
jgi:hypothetical protein